MMPRASWGRPWVQHGEDLGPLCFVDIFPGPRGGVFLNKPFNPDFRIARIQEGEAIAGDVRLHADFPSVALGNHRNIVVYLPPGYRRQRRRRYPVLYLQDGQNVFDARTSAFGVEWGLDEAAERLIAEDAIEPLIMVGIYNTRDRMAEYTPAWSESPGTGRAEDYARFVVDELKPFIDETYRTLPDREHTGVLGSSLGGLCSLYLSVRFPHTFSRAAAVSPSLWFGRGAMLRFLERMPHLGGPRRLWVCAGAQEGRFSQGTSSFAIQGIRRLREILLTRGFVEGASLFYCEDQDGRHDEASWARRAPEILRALFPSRRQLRADSGR